MEATTYSRVASRLLQQGEASIAGAVDAAGAAGAMAAATTTAGAMASNVFAQATHFVTSSFVGASLINQVVVLIVIGLSGVMLVLLGVMWTAEILGARRNRRAAEVVAEKTGFTTPTSTPLSLSLSPDLESPTKHIDDEVLAEVSTFNKGVQLIINESTDYSSELSLQHSGMNGSRARRQLNLKLKASPSLDRAGGFAPLGSGSAKFSPRDPTFSSMAIMRKQSNTNTANTDGYVHRKDTLGANDHARVVQPLTMGDLTVVESLRTRDIGKQGWQHNPRSAVSRRATAASSPAASPRDDFSPIGAFHRDITPREKLAVHESISQSIMPNMPTTASLSSLRSPRSPRSLQSAVSIGPRDVASLSSPKSSSPDERLNNIIVLGPEQFHNELVPIRLIGTGACGSVHEAIWRGSLCAVKILHPSKQTSEAAVATFRREVELMSGVGEHKHVLKIRAACLSPPNLCIVTELATNGSLHALIHDRRLRPEYSTLLDLAIQIADGVAFCHAKSLVHRDLKPHNILLDANNDVLVADFGLAMDMDENTMSMAEQPMGTSAYMAPEQFTGSRIDERCDSFAFGCVLWEMITGIAPWSECNNVMQIVMAVGLERKRPPLPKGVPQPIASLIRECWRHNSRLRPSMREICDRLRAIKREEQERQTFKAAAEMVTASSGRFASKSKKNQKVALPGATAVEANRSPFQSPASRAARAWNNQWSPIKGLNA